MSTSMKEEEANDRVSDAVKTSSVKKLELKSAGRGGVTVQYERTFPPFLMELA
jgi:hypothetical protein